MIKNLILGQKMTFNTNLQRHLHIELIEYPQFQLNLKIFKISLTIQN